MTENFLLLHKERGILSHENTPENVLVRGSSILSMYKFDIPSIFQIETSDISSFAFITKPP